MNHDFFIKNEKVFLDIDYVYPENRPDTIMLDDDFIWYIYDSLKWISFYNPSKQEFDKGLSLYGVTEIYGESLIQFRGILTVYKTLFEYAPNEIVLTGQFEFEYNVGMESGSCTKLVYNKKDILEKLNNLIKMCSKALSKNKSILHYGL